MTTEWHTQFPPGTERLWDLMAKAFVLRLGGSANFSVEELRAADKTPFRMRLDADMLVFEVDADKFH